MSHRRNSQYHRNRQLARQDYEPILSLHDGSYQYLSEVERRNHIVGTIKKYHKNYKHYQEERDLFEIQDVLSAKYIRETLTPHIELHEKTLCPLLGKAIKDLVYDTEIPIFNALIMILSQTLAAFQGNITLNIKDDWTESPSLYVIGMAPSGSRKSKIVKRLSAPFDDFSATLAEHTLSDDVIKECNRHLKNDTKEQIRIIFNTRKNNPSGNIGEDINKKLLDISRQHNELMESITPSKKNYMLDDFSYAGLLATLESNDGHVAVISAEGGIINTLIKEPNIQECVKKGYDFERICRSTSYKSTLIESPSLQLLLYVQPSEILKILNNRQMQEQGLTARFIFLPEHEPRGHAQQYSELDLDEYNQKICSLLKLFHCTKGKRNIRTLYASPQAAKVLTDFEGEIQDFTLPHMPEKSHPALRKLHGIAARLALAYHFWYAHSPLESELSEYAAQVGVYIAENLVSRLHEVYHEYGLVAQPMAKKIVEYVLSLKGLQRREAMDNHLELSYIAKAIHQRVADVEKGLVHLQMHNALYLYRTTDGRCKVILHHDFFYHFEPDLYELCLEHLR